MGRAASAVVLVVLAAASAAVAATPGKAAAAGVQPAQPLPGQWAEVNKLYYLGEDKRIAFALKSASFTCERLYFGDETQAPTAKEKMLALEFSLQNAGRDEWTVNWATVHFTAVDSSDNNREGVDEIGQAKSKEKLSISLKPAQKVDCYTCIMLPNDCQAPKLIVRPQDEGPVLRYDLHGKVKGLEAPYADSKDETGATALAEVPAEKGKAYSGAALDFRFDDLAFASGTYGDAEPEEGCGWVILSATVTNRAKEEWTLNWATLTPTLYGKSGTISFGNGVFADAEGTGGFGTSLEPGKSAGVQYCFQVKRGATLKSFALQEGDEGRKYVWDLGGVKAE